MQELPTEMGAEHVGIVQSLLEICRLHNIGPYDHFVDVLQRVKAHSHCSKWMSSRHITLIEGQQPIYQTKMHDRSSQKGIPYPWH